MEWLDELGVKYEEIDAENLGLQAVPVTEIGDTSIVGFDRPAILKALKQEGLLKKWNKTSSSYTAFAATVSV